MYHPPLLLHLLASCCLLLALASARNGGSVWGLRISSVEVPPAVMNASQVILVCNYDLQGDQLYSVKWYKNYVEFYRFQPTTNESPSSQASSTQSLGTAAAAAVADNQLHSKHEFELDGINLNLSKSNATHVYLQQVSLASEGTYKCELSAESPSFATISVERQMKVYILPKQKLSIVDNSLSSSTTSQPPLTNLMARSSAEHQQQQQQTMKPTLIYNINDFVNLTCVSSPSRPVARLTWLLNDIPVAATSKWLQHSSLSRPQNGDQLTETRLTLAFRLQPSHLLKGLSSTTTTGGGGGIESSARYQSLRLRCVSKLSVQFSSEASIIVSGGKTTIKRRQEISHASSASLPAPSSWSSGQQRGAESGGGDSDTRPRGVINLKLTNGDYPIYHWPRPLIGNAGRQVGGYMVGRRDPMHDIFSDPWSSRPMTGSGSAEPDAVEPEAAARPGSRASARHLVVWTNRQLREQADHIDHVMRLAQPNELDTPSIEGKIQLESSDEIGYSGDPITDTTSGGQSLGSTESSWNEYAGATITTNRPSVTLSNINQDYELDDLVQFTCKPRVGFTEANPIKSVASKWFINDKEIIAHLVNAFDGNKFYYSRDSYDPLPATGGRSRPSTQYSPSNAELELGLDTQQPTIASTEQSDYTTSPSSSPAAQSSSRQQQQQNYLNDSSLLVEFSSSLFQLKELNLKCRTVVEQPLIQYDNQLVISVPTGQFNSAGPNIRQRANGAFYNKGRPNSGRTNNNNGNHNRPRHGNAQSSSSSVSSVLVGWHYCLLSTIASHLIANIHLRALF